jgi:hypothetical protein
MSEQCFVFVFRDCSLSCDNLLLWICEVYNSISLGPAADRNEYQKKKRVFLESRARPVRMADNLTAICEPIVYTVWDPQHLTTL